jgi:hypothetical protein
MKLVHVFVQIQTLESPSMEKRILRLEDDCGGYAQTRASSPMQSVTHSERNALRAYLDEKGFKTAIIDYNLAIAGELT